MALKYSERQEITRQLKEILNSGGFITVLSPGSNKVLTDTGTASTITGESNLTFDGSQLNVVGDTTSTNIRIGDNASPLNRLEIKAAADISTNIVKITDNSGNDRVNIDIDGSNIPGIIFNANARIETTGNSNHIYLKSDGTVSLSNTDGGAKLDLGTLTPGVDTSDNFIRGFSADANWPFGVSTIYSSGNVDYYIGINAILDGGTQASPTFTGGTGSGFVIGKTGGASGKLEIFNIPNGTTQSANSILTIASNGDITISSSTTNLPSGHIFNYNSGDVTITHSANALTIAGGNTVVDSLTSGGNIVSDTDSTDDLGTSSVRWQTLYVDTLGDNGQALGIAATTLSFDTAATIDTSGNNQLDINTGSSNTVITAAAVTVSNDFTVDTTTLHVDSTNDNVGIGTATPNSLYSLDVVGDINFSGNLYQGGVLFSGGGGGGLWTQSGSDIYYNTGNVGIGNTGPSYNLDVTGDINFTGTLYQNGVEFVSGGGGGGAATGLWPNYVSTSNDAHKVVFADLNDGNYVWDWEEAKTLIRGTSWYALEGKPPVYGAFIIDASQNAIHWIDRGDDTLTPYMSFTVGTTNMAYGATISDIIFKDFKLYIVDNNVTGYGVTVIDFINDTSYLYTTSGVSKYNSNITNRNNGNGYMLLTSSPAIRDNNVNVIDVIEDQGGNLDDDGRPLHYWAAGTDAGLSLYIPSNTGGIGNIYDSSDANNVYSVSFVGGSLLWSISDTNDKTLIREVYSTVAADAFTTDYSMDSTQTDWSQTFFNGTETLTDTVAFINNEGEEISLVGSDQGLSIHKLYGGEIAMTSTFVTPYMKGTRIAAYPLLDTNDKSGNGYDFTSQASPPTFSTAGIYGNSASFDGTQYLVQTVTDFGPVSDFTISLMMKTNDNTLPVADEFLARLTDGTNHSLSLWATTSGGINFNVYNNPTTDSWISNSVYDSQWHHIVFTRSGSTYYAYIDGILVNTWASTVSSATNLTQITIGGDQLGTQLFGGQIEQVFFGKSALTSKEVADEYDRMQFALAGSNGLLTATDIDTIKIHLDNGYAIVTAGDAAHIMNANLGIIYDTDVVSAGTLNDADIKTISGATEPHYLLAGSTSLEQVAPATTEDSPNATGGAGGDANVSTIFFLMGA